MLMTVVTIVHIFACLFLILVVLLQTGKGAEMGAIFGGGGSQTIFGASGAGNLLTKLTTATAIVFFLTSLTLAWSSLARTRRTVFDQPLPEPPPPAASTPAANPPPADAPAASGAAEKPAGETAAPPAAEPPAAPAAEGGASAPAPAPKDAAPAPAGP